MNKLISLKIDEKILLHAETVIEQLGVSRYMFTNNAVAAITKAQKRAELDKQLKREPKIIQENSMEVLADFEVLEDDYEAI
jgi:hypothetical protein